ncbi:hypothetical protein GCM10009651_36330 [Microbacterium natoriense]
MSPRRLLGWEPGEITTFEYDDADRLVRAVTVREPEFSAWDRAVLLADAVDSKAPRGAHGLLLSEVTKPENQFAYDVPRTPLGIPMPGIDWAQKALDDAQEQYRKAFPKEPMGSKLWRVIDRG